MGQRFEGPFVFMLLEMESAGGIKVDDAVVIAGYRADATSAGGIFESYESHESSKEETILADYAGKTALTLFFEMRKNSLAEKFGLTRAVVAPDFEHDVRATGGAILFDLLDALVGSAGNGADFAQDFVGHCLGGGFAAAFFHRVRDGLKLFKGEARAFEQRVSGAPDVLHLIGEVHGRLLAGAFLALCGIAANAADDDGTQHKIGDVLPCLASAFIKILERVANKCRRGDTGREQAVADGAGHLLHDRAGPRDIDRREPTTNWDVPLQRGDSRRERFFLLFQRCAPDN